MCRVMGIVNVTPDSFSDGGKFNKPEEAIRRAKNLVEEGAAIIDIGGESTRPGATPISWEEEWARIEPVLKGLTTPATLQLFNFSTFSRYLSSRDGGASCRGGCDNRQLRLPRARLGYVADLLKKRGRTCDACKVSGGCPQISGVCPHLSRSHDRVWDDARGGS